MLTKLGILCVFLLVFCAFAVAQAEEDSLTVKLRDATDERGRVFVEEYTELGTLTAEYGVKVLFQTLVVTFPDQGRSVKGILIKIITPGSEITKDTSFAADEEATDEETVYSYIDEDEIAALSKGITTMLTVSEKWEDGKSERSVNYVTRDDLRINVTKYPESMYTSIYGYDYESSGIAFLKSPETLLTVKGFLDKGLRLITALK